MWFQQEITFTPKRRGFHLVTDEIVRHIPRIERLKIGVVHVFIKHSSASLTINENADPTVRGDMERHFNELAPENTPYYQHTYEGPDDMPAHLKATLIGANLTIPVTDGQLNLGVWQGIYLCEHRDHGSGRTVVVTVHGEE